LSGSTERTDPHDEDAIDPDGDPEFRNPGDERDVDHEDTTDPDLDPDGDPELRNPRDERDVDHEDTTDPDTDPDIVNPRDTRTD